MNGNIDSHHMKHTRYKSKDRPVRTACVDRSILSHHRTAQTQAEGLTAAAEMLPTTGNSNN